MDHRWILPVPEYYARLNSYILGAFAIEPQEEIQDREYWAALLRGALGEAGEQSVLDCSCGWGTQTIPLAKLGWQVTACDISETSLEHCRKCVSQEGLSVDFRICDMRDLAQVFDRRFDWVVSCYALYELPTDEGIRQAIRGMFAALKPGGKCFLLFRDMDELMEDQPRHEFHGERRLPNERIIWVQDWEYESEDQVVALDAFLREDLTRDPSDYLRWTTETIGIRKKVMRKAKLQAMLLEEGFYPVTYLPRPEPWDNPRLIAVRPV